MPRADLKAQMSTSITQSNKKKTGHLIKLFNHTRNKIEINVKFKRIPIELSIQSYT